MDKPLATERTILIERPLGEHFGVDVCCSSGVVAWEDCCIRVLR